jgi:creatinine amidohydrolase/Fe(II)-dependent formamide hydrolase-like protein
MMLTWQNTACDFEDHPPRIAVLPLACTEPHGAHLPVGTDRIIIGEIARRTAERLDAPTVLLPTWSLGTSGHHAGQAGALSLRFETLWSMVRDVVTALHEHGIHQVAVINNHGSAMTGTARPIGNFIVKTAVRQLNYETPGLTAIWIQPFAAARAALAEILPSANCELHAGAVETCLLLHLAPDLVGTLPPDNVPSISPSYLHFAPFAKLVPAGIWGKPSEASAETGVRALDALVQATIDYIETTFAQLERIKK